jgi:hypothetical protein
LGRARFLEGDQPAGELKQGEVVVGFLRPADQERPVAVEPGVAGLDDPATCPPAGSEDLELELVAATADVRRQAAAADQLVHPRIVVAAVKAEPLRQLRARLGALERDGVERRL